MTVGQELEKLSGLKLFHNHMTIDLVTKYFGFSTPQGQKLVANIRLEFFRAFAGSSQPGFIFTLVWSFDDPNDQKFIEEVSQIFEEKGAEVFWIELETNFTERLKRNRTENRLKNKPSKRDLKVSEKNLISGHQTFRQNSLAGEISRPNYHKIDNSDLTAAAAAEQVFRLIT
ncbi:hypothetical protein [Maritalea sp.]|uniref:hypothetical protein n=1 Tax=Maritalea sp. TaxID=2003361 RepID=UPI003EF64F12